MSLRESVSKENYQHGKSGLSAKYLLPVFFTAALLGCDSDSAMISEQSEEKKGVSESVTDSYQSIYVDRVIESLIDGVNKQQEGYQLFLQECQEAGVDTTPLSKEEADKIGTKRWQLWRTGDSVAYKEEEWTYQIEQLKGARASCHFSIIHTGAHVYLDQTKSVEVNISTGERVEWEAQPQEFEVFDASPDTDELSKWSSWGPVWKNVDGHKCAEWTSLLGEKTCYWSEGVDQGIYYTPLGSFSSNASFPTRSIALRVVPPEEGMGESLRTVKFVTGEAVDTSKMKP